MSGKRIVVLGAGESGTGAAKLAKKQGFDVFVSDTGKIKDKYKKVLSNTGIEWEEGQHTRALIMTAGEVVKSPGIPDDTPIIRMLRQEGIPVISEIEFAGRFTGAKMIAITGSNGKTTTTLLTHHILKKAGLNVGLAGNMGQSLAGMIAEQDHEYYVIELSSFQLDGMFSFKAHIAILLNITPDHLDRYDNSFQGYIDSKFRIAQNQTADDFFIYCDDDQVIREGLEKKSVKAKKLPFSIQHPVEEGAYLKEDQLIININHKQTNMSIHNLALQGKHNLYNSMAAGIAARILELRKEVIRDSMSDFQNVEHRLEFVAKVAGIRFINDSKATNINATWYALETMESKVVWIVGGVDKGNDYSSLGDVMKDKVKAIVCLGKDNSKIHAAFEGKVPILVETASMPEAVGMAYRLGSKGDTVLLSPACASFDLFENYEDRGHQFKEAVRAL